MRLTTSDAVVPRADAGIALLDYRLRITYPSGHVVEIDDPYRYGRVLTDFDLHLLGEGTHNRAFEKLGSHRITVGSTTGVHFAVWAPNADRVSVIGDFNGVGRPRPSDAAPGAERRLGDIHPGSARRPEIQVRDSDAGRRDSQEERSVSPSRSRCRRRPRASCATSAGTNGATRVDDRPAGLGIVAGSARWPSTKCTSGRGRACRTKGSGS